MVVQDVATSTFRNGCIVSTFVLEQFCDRITLRIVSIDEFT